jgi:hypothetical protein
MSANLFTCEFHKNQCNKTHTLGRVVTKFRSKASTHKSLKCIIIVRVNWVSVQARNAVMSHLCLWNLLRLLHKTFVPPITSRSLNHPLPSVCSCFSQNLNISQVYWGQTADHTLTLFYSHHTDVANICLHLILACGKRRQSYNSRPSARIVGGVESTPGDWPFLAAILGGPEEVFYCAGVIISDQWVLSASHCVGK